MAVSPQITLRGMGPSPAIERAIRRKMSWLQRYFPHIIGCRVTLEAPHRHQRKGRLYHVRIDMTVPGGELVVTRDPSQHLAHGDVLVAIRDGFDAARRELMDYARLQRGQVKASVGTQNGRVTRLEADHGFLESEDGREVYFHRESVRQGFERLGPGTKVRFTEERGDKGPQASTVDVVRSRSKAAGATGRG
jgi:cold shock CspA family protein/ribosome-associated translation inhibitor RaiA